jgi:hypothetical protein
MAELNESELVMQKTFKCANLVKYCTCLRQRK